MPDLYCGFDRQAAQDLLRTQMTAILRLALECDIRGLLPMILGGSDLHEAVTLIRQFAGGEGIAELPPIGALFETPSAVFSIGDVLRYADFLSIGTNDLSQCIRAGQAHTIEAAWCGWPRSIPLGRTGRWYNVRASDRERRGPKPCVWNPHDW